jgi:hypothetical protein
MQQQYLQEHTQQNQQTKSTRTPPVAPQYTYMLTQHNKQCNNKTNKNQQEHTQHNKQCNIHADTTQQTMQQQNQQEHTQHNKQCNIHADTKQQTMQHTC